MTSKRLWILEGPDGAGKSTLAAELVTDGAHVVHCGPFPSAGRGLARLYVEAMLPALLGHCDVVLDRSWLSEPIYADAMRNGQRRLTAVDLRMLERVASRCATTVVHCLPSLERCLATYRARRGEEYLTGEAQLEAVHRAYAAGLATTLPCIEYDFTTQPVGFIKRLVTDYPASSMTSAHPLAIASAGRLDARVLVVGENFGEVTNYDTRYQLPFVSFGLGGCSQWLTGQLEDAGVTERQLLWANADQDLAALLGVARDVRVIAALGAVAEQAVNALGFDGAVIAADHPQYAKRFNYVRGYPLGAQLKEYL